MMTDFNYKKYSLENLENWLHDAMSAGEASPQEIYDVILDVVKDNYYTYKEQASKAYELLALLNGNNPNPKQKTLSYQEMIDAGYEMTADGFWFKEHPIVKEDQVTRWVLPVQVDGPSGEYYINLPDDLLARAGLHEGDMIHWIDRGDGSFELRKVNGTK